MRPVEQPPPKCTRPGTTSRGRDGTRPPTRSSDRSPRRSAPSSRHGCARAPAWPARCGWSRAVHERVRLGRPTVSRVAGTAGPPPAACPGRRAAARSRSSAVRGIDEGDRARCSSDAASNAAGRAEAAAMAGAGSGVNGVMKWQWPVRVPARTGDEGAVAEAAIGSRGWAVGASSTTVGGASGSGVAGRPRRVAHHPAGSDVVSGVGSRQPSSAARRRAAQAGTSGNPRRATSPGRRLAAGDVADAASTSPRSSGGYQR